MTFLDRTNLRIIEILQRNARTSLSDIARQVGRGESTVRERVGSLEQGGVLRGYHAEVDHARLGLPIVGLLRGEALIGSMPALAQRLETVPHVLRADVVTGPKPLRIQVAAESLDHLEHVVEQRIIPLGVGRIETGVVIQRLVDLRPLPLLGAGPMAPELSIRRPERPPLGNGRHDEHPRILES